MFSLLLSLPEEIIASIISLTPDTELLALSRTCRKLKRICSSPLEMKERCMQFRFWEQHHNIDERVNNPDPTQIDWKTMFEHRYKVEIQTTDLLNKIIEFPMDHIERFNKIADFGYDAKDCLARNAEVGDDEVPDPLARRWYATHAIRYIHRRRALSIIRRVNTHDDVPLEVALASIELFNAEKVSPDVEDTVREFENLTEKFRYSCPEFSKLSTTQEKTECLIEWLWDQGFVGTPVDRYRALKNTFIGMTMRTVRTAIPLTLVAIFCGVARRVGLKTHVCGYPSHVYAIVEDDITREYQYYHMYLPQNGSREQIRMDEARLRAQLSNTEDCYMLPAKTSDLMIRLSQNILNTLQLPPSELLHQNYGYPFICQHSTLYGALTIMVVLEPFRVTRGVVRHMTQQIPDDFPMDVRFLEEELLVRIDNPRDRKLMENVCNALRAEDSTPKMVSRRDTPETETVAHRVGTVFRHKRYGLNGVIFGWTPTCSSAKGEVWIKDMKVDNLSKGRKQPFYNSLVEDGTVRYVAEENIVPILPSSGNVVTKSIGRYFKRFNKEEGKFVSNVMHEFPDD